MRRGIIFLTLIYLLLPATFSRSARAAESAPPEIFEGCGSLRRGVGPGCTLLEVAPGLEYLVDETGPFQVGDFVRVKAEFIVPCITTCMQGSGCLRVREISACIDPHFVTQGELGSFVFDLCGDYQIWGDEGHPVIGIRLDCSMYSNHEFDHYVGRRVELVGRRVRLTGCGVAGFGDWVLCVDTMELLTPTASWNLSQVKSQY